MSFRALITAEVLALLTACGHEAAPPVQRSDPPPPLAPKAAVVEAPSVEATVRALQDAALASKNGEKIARSLATDVGARIAGGPKDAPARAWALAKMKELGLSNVHAEAVKVPHWERGAASADVAGQKLKVLALGGSIGTPPQGIDAEVVELADFEALEKSDAAALKGKIAFVNQPMRRAKDGSGYGAAVRARFQAPRVALDRGAVAAVVRSIGTDTEVPHTGATKRDVKIPSAALSGESADKLHALLEGKKRVRMKLTLQATWHEEADSANIVGEVPGAEEPDRVVLLGAHLDSWDVGQGAIDDGAGCAIVLEAARIVAALGRAPRRTIRVVLFAAEEIGVTGGDGYAKAHAAEAPRFVMTMEADMGTARSYAARFLGPADARTEFERIGGLLKPLGVELEPRDAFGGADMSALRSLGVPAFELAQDFSTYFDVHHTENDTVDRLDGDGIAQTAAGYASVAWAAAQMNGDFGRVPEDKRH